MLEKQIDIATADGAMPTFIAHPAGQGPFPVVLVLMDGGGMRPALQDVARRLGRSGYYAMLPDLYYRAGPGQPGDLDAPGGWERMLGLVASLSNEKVIADAAALLDHVRGDTAARSGAVAVMGFCMGGRFSLIVAQGLGQQVVAAAAIHPGNLASDADDSAHRALDRVGAELYLAIADRDQWCTPEQVARMEEALLAQGVVHEVEWHRGALHGFGVPGGASYDEAAAERVWQKVGALFARTLA